MPAMRSRKPASRRFGTYCTASKASSTKITIATPSPAGATKACRGSSADRPLLVARFSLFVFRRTGQQPVAHPADKSQRRQRQRAQRKRESAARKVRGNQSRGQRGEQAVREPLQ